MASNWMRRAALVLASGAALLLSSCGGGGDIVSQLIPTRVVVFGDGLSDLGQQAGKRYTVNDNTINNWAQFVALGFGLPLTSAATGGTGYAAGNARIVAEPDAAGGTATQTIAEQVDAFLATNTASSPGDVLMIGGGISDIIYQMGLVTSGAQTADQMLNNVGQAGRDLAAQAKRLTAAGATHVVVTGAYDLGKSPWSTAISQNALLTQASLRFNEELLVALVNEGNKMLYVDAALLFNLLTINPGGYGFLNAIAPACTSVDAGPGIGIGTGQVNSALCTSTTILTGVDYNLYVFADRVYFTPQAHRKFGEYAFSRIRNRW